MADKGVAARQGEYLAKVRQAGMQVDAGEVRPASDGSFDPSLLFEPLDLGSVMLPNRIVMAPMTRNMSPGGVPGSDVVAYYRRRAEGGIGFVITEGTYVPQGGSGFSDNVPHFHGEDALAVPEDQHRRVADLHLRLSVAALSL